MEEKKFEKAVNLWARLDSLKRFKAKITDENVKLSFVEMDDERPSFVNGIAVPCHYHSELRKLDNVLLIDVMIEYKKKILAEIDSMIYKTNKEIKEL